MGLFNTILSKLGFGHADVSAPAPAPATADPAPTPSDDVAVASQSTPAIAAISEVDVVVKLDGLAATNPQKLNWKVSIVDLLKLLDIDSSLDARKNLAMELNCPVTLMMDSAQMNMWLHKTVLQKLAENGGNIPKELL